MKLTTISLVNFAATLGIVACLLGGCAWSVGGPKQGGSTRGQEFIDLKKARDNGAISEDEYQTQKKRVLGQ